MTNLDALVDEEYAELYGPKLQGVASNATAEQVAVVLGAFAEEFLVDVPATFDGKGTYLIEYNTLAEYLLNPDKARYQAVADYINKDS